MSKTNGVRCTNHFHIEIPVENWGKPFTCPHGLSDGRGSGYTPHQAFVTAVYVVGDSAPDSTSTSSLIRHPIEAGVVRMTGMDATKLTLVVGPEPTAPFVDMLKQKIKNSVRSMLVEIYTRFVMSYELGSTVIADDMQQSIPCGWPISLL